MKEQTFTVQRKQIKRIREAGAQTFDNPNNTGSVRSAPNDSAMSLLSYAAILRGCHIQLSSKSSLPFFPIYIFLTSQMPTDFETHYL